MVHLYRAKKKDGSYYPRWRFQYTTWEGKRTTGLGTTSKTETEKLAHGVQSKEDFVRKGWSPAPKAADKPHPFEAAKQEYLDWGKSQGGWGGRPWSSSHAHNREYYLTWWQKRLNLETVGNLVGTLPRVEEALRELQKKPLNENEENKRFRSSRTLFTYQDGLRAFCLWAVSRGYLEADPLKGMTAYSTDPQEIRRSMSPEEIQRLLNAASSERRLLYVVALASGLRLNELRSLRVGNLDLEQSCLHLSSQWTKNRKAGRQPLPKWVSELLRKEAQGKEAGDSLLRLANHNHVSRQFDKDLEAAGIPKRNPAGKLNFHALRTTFINLLYEADALPKEHQELSRHLTPGLTLTVYARAKSERLNEVAERVGETLKFSDRNIPGASRKAVGDGTPYPESREMVGATGFEASPTQPEELSNAGQRNTSSSLKQESPDVYAEDAQDQPDKARQIQASPKAASDAAGTYQEHTESVPKDDLELNEILKAWPSLPHSIRAGILAMVQAASQEGNKN